MQLVVPGIGQVGDNGGTEGPSGAPSDRAVDAILHITLPSAFSSRSAYRYTKLPLNRLTSNIHPITILRTGWIPHGRLGCVKCSSVA